MSSAPGRRDLTFFILLAAVSGIFLAGYGIPPILFLITAFGAVLFLRGRGAGYALIFFALVSGFWYFHAYRFVENEFTRLPAEGTVFEAVVTAAEYRESGQKLELRLSPPYRGKITALAPPYPKFEYGDKISLSGRISENFLPHAEIFSAEPGHGFWIKERLLAFRETILDSYLSLLPEKEALFLGGLTLGAKNELPRELKREMMQSGTTHLVALSGYNIGLVLLGIGAVFSSWMKRTATFILTVLIVILFVIMTGGEASIVRASLMGGIALLAHQAGRLHDLRNSIAAAAFAMALFNPSLPYFNLGYQLSFASMIGIAYLLPAIEAYFGLAPGSYGLFKEGVLTTLAAQGAVLPLLFSAFGAFSAGAIIANALILPAVPITMFLGFLTGGAALISPFAGSIIAPLLAILLSYELWIIRAFAALPMLQFDSMSPYLFFAYYALLFGFILSYPKHEA